MGVGCDWGKIILTAVDLSNLLPAIGGFSGAAAIGALLGYGLKKLLRVLLIVMAALTTIVALPLSYLAYKGVVTVDWTKLYDLIQSGSTMTANFIANLIQTTSVGFPMLGGFGAGFAVGLKKG